MKPEAFFWEFGLSVLGILSEQIYWHSYFVNCNLILIFGNVFTGKFGWYFCSMSVMPFSVS